MKPFTNSPAEAVSALREIALLRAMREWLGIVSPPSPQGMGDDCAVLDLGATHAILAKSDGIVYGRHFDDTAEPTAVAAKLLKRNLSDIAAMGGTPKHALVHLVIGRNLSSHWLKEFYTGLAKSCEEYGITVAGGGTAQGPDGLFAADLTLLGVAGANVLLRAGAEIGDAIFVTGELGGSILGKHLDFTPRLVEGQWLAGQVGVRGAIDLSDGLAKDLPEILPPDSDALIDTRLLPISVEAKKLEGQDKRPALTHALTDGEDYELLFALNSSVNPRTFATDWKKTFSTPLSQIGVIAAADDRRHDRQLRDATTGKPLLQPGEGGHEHLR
jgi:thiamine-monophosphate kinase